MCVYLLLRNSGTPRWCIAASLYYTAINGTAAQGARRSSPPQLKTRPVAKPDAPPLNAAGRTGKMVRVRQKQYSYQVHHSLRIAYEVNRLHSWLSLQNVLILLRWTISNMVWHWTANGIQKQVTSNI